MEIADILRAEGWMDEDIRDIKQAIDAEMSVGDAFGWMPVVRAGRALLLRLRVDQKPHLGFVLTDPQGDPGPSRPSWGGHKSRTVIPR